MWNVLTRRPLIFWWSATRKPIKGTSSSTQWIWLQCNLIVLWAVTSGASAQTVPRPTVALPSGFWLYWIQIIHPTGLKLKLDWEMRYILNLTMKPVPISEEFVLWCHLTPASVRENSTVLQHGWDEVDEACWLVKNNVQVLYMHKSLTVKDVRKNVQKREIHNKLQLTECIWMNENGITRNTGHTFPILVNGSSNKQILDSDSLSSSSWSTLHYTKCVRRIVIYIV
jgi:hypothetical protein